MKQWGNFSRIKMLAFRDIKNEKNKFYHHKSPVPQKDVNIKKKYSSLKNYKYVIGQLQNDHKIRQLYIMLPQTSSYVKRYERQIKWMFFDCRS